MQQLNNARLGQLKVATPNYDRSTLQAGIVHLGIGAFHRGHQADYTDQLMNSDGGNWGIVGASLRSPGMRDLLQPQDGLYSLVENDGESQHIRIVGSIQRVLVAPESPEQLITELANPAIKVVTLTITEKGYCHDPATGDINWEHPDIIHDLQYFASQPKSAIGFLAAALIRRHSDNAAVTLLSCDNLSHNGRLLERVIKAFIERVCPEILPWVDASVTFPCSMVDRIVPAVTEDDIERLSHTLGVFDAGAVFTESFCQWVIEDSFAAERPSWENAGALLVDDVSPFEEMKLRLLNGSHSLIAYLGVLAGFDFVHEVMENPTLKRWVRAYMDAVTPTLTIPDGFDIEDYKAQLCERFSNASLRHRTLQIAMDGSQKIPQRWLPPLRQLLESNSADTSFFSLALAGWIRFLHGLKDCGQTYRVDDPLYESLKKILSASDDADVCQNILEYAPVFGNFFQNHPDFIEDVFNAYRSLCDVGVLQTLSERGE